MYSDSMVDKATVGKRLDAQLDVRACVCTCSRVRVRAVCGVRVRACVRSYVCGGVRGHAHARLTDRNQCRCGCPVSIHSGVCPLRQSRSSEDPPGIILETTQHTDGCPTYEGDRGNLHELRYESVKGPISWSAWSVLLSQVSYDCSAPKRNSRRGKKLLYRNTSCLFPTSL